MLQQHSKHLNKSTNKLILTVYQLFHSCIPIQPHPCLLWQARCSWSNWLTWERLYPQDAIANDYPIYIEIKYILDLLHLIISTFYHMKGHEDEKTYKSQMLPKSLNMDCDKRASELPDNSLSKQPLHYTQLPTPPNHKW